MKYKIFSHIFFLILALMAGFFYMERILYADSAFQFFKIINFEKFNIEAGRFSAVLTQVIPILAVKMGADLKLLILSYSVSFVLIYYLVYLACVYIFKDQSAGILIIFLLVLGIRSSFFHTVTETHQGLVYSGLFLAWMYNSFTNHGSLIREGKSLAIGFSIIILCFFSHPVTFLILVYIIGYFLIDLKKWKDYRIYSILVFIFLIYLIKFLITPSDSYEGQYFTGISDSFRILKNVFQTQSFRFFIHNIYHLYIPHLIISLIVILFYLKRKLFLKLSYYILAILAFLFITFISYYQGDSPMAMEKNFMPLNLFVCLPFVKEILWDLKKGQLLKFIFVIIIIGVSLYNICTESTIYRSRISYLGHMMNYSEKFTGEKFLIAKKDIDMDRIIIPWALSVETLLYSSLESADSTKTFFISEDPYKLNFDRKDPDLFLCTDFWLNWNSKELNRKYFRLKEGRYRVIDEYIH